MEEKIILYHGSQHSFENFDFDRNVLGYHFGDLKIATHFAGGYSLGEGWIYEVELTMRNLTIVEDIGDHRIFGRCKRMLYDSLNRIVEMNGTDAQRRKLAASHLEGLDKILNDSRLETIAYIYSSLGINTLYYNNEYENTDSYSYIAMEPSSIEILNKFKLTDYEIETARETGIFV